MKLNDVTRRDSEALIEASGGAGCTLRSVSASGVLQLAAALDIDVTTTGGVTTATVSG